MQFIRLDYCLALLGITASISVSYAKDSNALYDCSSSLVDAYAKNKLPPLPLGEVNGRLTLAKTAIENPKDPADMQITTIVGYYVFDGNRRSYYFDINGADFGNGSFTTLKTQFPDAYKPQAAAFIGYLPLGGVTYGKDMRVFTVTDANPEDAARVLQNPKIKTIQGAEGSDRTYVLKAALPNIVKYVTDELIEFKTSPQVYKGYGESLDDYKKSLEKSISDYYNTLSTCYSKLQGAGETQLRSQIYDELKRYTKSPLGTEQNVTLPVAPGSSVVR